MLSEFALFFILTISFTFFVLTILYYGEQKRSLSVFFIITTIIFYTPAVYYTVFSGTAYRVFAEHSYLQYIIYSTILFLLLSMFLIFKNMMVVGGNIKLTNEPNNLVHLYITYMTLGILGYILIFIDRFPLYSLLVNGVRIERPDMSGAIPLYFTVSTFIFFVLPSYFLYYYERINSNLLKVVGFVILSGLLILGGNKGVLVYFYIFVWIFIFKLKINYKLLIMVVIAFSAYLFITGSAVASGIRRFFATQGAALVVRFDMMHNEFPFDFNKINTQVFEYMYGYSGGSGPSFFVGDFMIMYGYLLGTIIMIFIISIFFWLSKYIDVLFSNRLFILWGFTASIYILGMGSLDFPAFCRIIAVFLNIAIILSLENIKNIHGFVVSNFSSLKGFKVDKNK
ncbi:hypothetical protein KO561_17100 [Radiobacillus kanasensis]|uniref:hypothetical protein n=1 Tax=Radiobacillus kanasensis TaxID=2844358 RepID=UPI001E2DE600|nr:hypothetical protein [Radiobacillus kanasensis]UFT98890.1 hypothetical protein KO561_17100 [Radiobacillus kanasensis]